MTTDRVCFWYKTLIRGIEYAFINTSWYSMQTRSLDTTHLKLNLSENLLRSFFTAFFLYGVSCLSLYTIWSPIWAKFKKSFTIKTKTKTLSERTAKMQWSRKFSVASHKWLWCRSVLQFPSCALSTKNNFEHEKKKRNFSQNAEMKLILCKRQTTKWRREISLHS